MATASPFDTSILSLLSPPFKKISKPTGQRLSVIVEEQSGMPGSLLESGLSIDAELPLTWQDSLVRRSSTGSDSTIATDSTKTKTMLTNAGANGMLLEEDPSYRHDAVGMKDLENAEKPDATCMLAERERQGRLMICGGCLGIHWAGDWPRSWFEQA